MSELRDHVARVIREHRLLRPGQRVLVAVSGGVDSLVLLRVLEELARGQRWRLTVAHLNHQLRGRSSDADERLVCREAARLKLPVVVERVAVGRLGRAQGGALEMAARKARHDFLAGTAVRLRIPTIALAHQADDQVELFFLRLLRGSGGEGLAGMKWRGPSPSNPGVELIRPLLDQPKSALCQFAREQGIRHREDASNARLDFQRNRIRHELLPLLRRNYQPALDRAILRLMAIIGDESEFVGAEAGRWLEGGAGVGAERAGSKGRGGKGARRPLSPGARSASRRLRFEELPVAVQRRCVQMQLARQGVVPDFQRVEELRLKAGKKVAVGVAASAGDGARRSPQRKDERAARGEPIRYAVRDSWGEVRVEEGAAEMFGTGSRQVELRGRAGELEFGGVRICWRLRSGGNYRRGQRSEGKEYFDADLVGSPVIVRYWRPGDRFQPIGMAGSVKLQDFFTNQKVPRDQRRRLVVGVNAAGEIFWVEGMRIGERGKLHRGTIRRLQWCWKRL